jgi:hypothetical protein
MIGSHFEIAILVEDRQLRLLREAAMDRRAGEALAVHSEHSCPRCRILRVVKFRLNDPFCYRCGFRWRPSIRMS